MDKNTKGKQGSSKGKKKPRLSPKMKLFCIEYLIDFNATQACIRAGYSPKTAKSMGSENLSKPVIQAEIDRVVEEAMEKRKATLHQRVLQELESIAYADVTTDARVVTKMIKEPVFIDGLATGEFTEKEVQYVEFTNTIDSTNKRAIAGIKQSDKGAIEIKYHSKEKALELLGKYGSLFTDKLEITGKDGAPIETIDYSNLTPDAAKELFHKRANEAKEEK